MSYYVPEMSWDEDPLPTQMELREAPRRRPHQAVLRLKPDEEGGGDTPVHRSQLKLAIAGARAR